MEGVEGVGGAANLDRLERSCASLRLTVVASMAHITWKWSETGKGTEKWHKILTTSLKNLTLPLTKISYAISSPKYKITLTLKLLPLFVMNDKR